MAEGTGQGQNTDELAELIGRCGVSDKRLDGEEQAAANGETARSDPDNDPVADSALAT